jgi:hypothetical protein
MEWIIALIVVIIMPLGMISLVGTANAIGFQNGKDRTAREPAPMTLADEAASSPSRRSYVGLSRA